MGAGDWPTLLLQSASKTYEEGVMCNGWFD
jgi:hypothetical protein